MIILGISLSFVDWLAIAGVSLATNILLLVWLLLIFFKKYIFLHRSISNNNLLIQEIASALDNGDLNLSIEICNKNHSVVSSVLHKGILKVGQSVKKIENAMQQQASIELRKLEFGINYFVNISILSPVIAFVGAMVAINWQNYFYANYYTDTVKLWLASATVLGVLVGLIAQFAYNYFVNQLSKAVYYIDYASLWLIDYLHENK